MNASTSEAEVPSAAALHVFAALILLDPALAKGALLALLALHKCEELLIIFVPLRTFLVLLTCGPSMVLNSAVETESCLAFGAI